MTSLIRNLLPRALVLTGILALNVRAQRPGLAAMIDLLTSLRDEVGAMQAENAALRQ